MTTITRTGYDLREGSRILAERFAEQERSREVADAILRRWTIQRLARKALDIIDGKRAA